MQIMRTNDGLGNRFTWSSASVGNVTIRYRLMILTEGEVTQTILSISDSFEPAAAEKIARAVLGVEDLFVYEYQDSYGSYERRIRILSQGVCLDDIDFPSLEGDEPSCRNQSQIN